MARQHHHLKTETAYYQLAEQRVKNFEVRINDRNYQTGDMVYLTEVVHGHPTGRESQGREIKYVLHDFATDGIKPGWVVFGFDGI